MGTVNVNATGKIQKFTWTKYLKATRSIPAPPTNFKQFRVTPINQFQLGMKLEVKDPNNQQQSTCIATVVGLQGRRLRLRLDGCDDKNDFWRLVDSGEIHPIGHCAENGGTLQAPVGFRMHPSSWPAFLQFTLNSALMAPAKVFKKERRTPKRNDFRVGMKLEAVDRINPHLIRAATIDSVNGDMIHITFDGWKGAFDYWCGFDSRDIFPVGWCGRNGHMLQPPGEPGVMMNVCTTEATESTCGTSAEKLETSPNEAAVESVAEPESSSECASTEDENEHLKLCKICMAEEIGVMFLSCGHLISCSKCASSVKDCPLCLKEIHGTARVHFS